jgi:hypothetical protein
MVAKTTLWLVVKLIEALASRYMTAERGEARRTQLIDYLCKRADKAKETKTEVDEQVLMYWAGFLKSQRLKDRLIETF